MSCKNRIIDFNYPLPEDKIAIYPVNKRDNSKLLVYRDEKISEDTFNNISRHIDDNSLLIFNNTKVVKARLIFHKTTGAKIEIFCLEPPNYNNISTELESRGSVKWNCLVGNSRRWTSGELSASITIDGREVKIRATRMTQNSDHSEIFFEWDSEDTFAEILDNFGRIPLPPYIHREAQDSDNDRYQTVYASTNGSVAAPTAGLHFTTDLIEELKSAGIDIDYLTLHVGLGTFKPVSEEFIEDHNMHSERIVISKQLVEKLYHNENKTVIPVGTTSCRSLESLFWLGVKLIENSDLQGVLNLDQWYPYTAPLRDKVGKKESLGTILNWLDKNNEDNVEANTSLMITPEYRCRITDAIITNFHQPQSTLLLLISSIIGDKWREVYEYALEHDFRFLSYGDSCFFYRKS